MGLSRGALAACGAYLLWGVLPVYWKAIADVPAMEILAVRILGSAVVLAVLLGARRDWTWLAPATRDRRVLATFAATAGLLATNWYLYVWSNNNGHMVEASLGYFVTPLVSVVLGLAVLRERLRRGQWLAVGVAASGVAYLVAHAQGLLWVSLALALSFGTYGLLRKSATLGSVHGLSLEMVVLFVPALALWVRAAGGGEGYALFSSLPTDILLAGAGTVTVAPLLLFAYGARRVTLVTLGILQYVAPTLQFVLGVAVYGEAFGRDRLVGFALIWLALAIYSVEGVVNQRTGAAAAVGAARPD